ncbi:DNA segregation ATPase, FtsK/SpoIIIE family [Mycobacteroides abscessus subsp. abscessus]|uniref:DNA segregation ATPase, FtsK/SpoIIIE family n=1 Tax=Mycobacteroides abscessus subsp. abscessus TaxID=1185650 RepID=A0AB38D7U3_9MYCO|nr:DNA segregation ATPase, FtsK/SpoIIIE family [Mycobacteroides abscessus subsp. abscessus]SIC24952.1 DNA segregation ATPase, FtsK/SpoIIIE family [Mycobacteroides abscessus subsp. abscessus]SIC34181.1 DNA segregation ATPase, FtsK/SpoIIIE family [Mycobacteroides abscessus subsp. abscessus]SIC42241.1 DNA segregation ATPase, FtsK/SpoIIIE family [Mycobacteroides abscessus subsp. abscessus]SKR84199.1 DNA segregation ATPase, FtsK/SpoIIIE family [Mycobacteroides abscessus subsp. abscessus]
MGRVSGSNRAARRAAMARQQHARDEFMWRQDVRRQEQAHRDLLRDSDAADAERARTEERVKTILTRAQSDAERAVADVAKRYGAEERRLLSAPITRYTGATRNLSGGLVVWHWRAACPPALAARLGVQRNDAGPLAVLRPGGGLTETDSCPDVFVGLDATLLDDAEFMAWAAVVAELWHGDVQQRYGILGTLRDDDWFARLSESAGIADSTVDSETVTGRYGPVERKVTTVGIPSIAGVEVTQDGLEISFSHSPNASAAKWASKLDLLRNGFRAQGMDSSNLRLTDSTDGGVVMRFDDAPSSFPAAVCIEPPSTVASSNADAIRRYEGSAWTLGVDARGKVIKFPVEDFPHVLVVGGTGAGKSVWARSIIEMFRTGYTDPNTGSDTAGGFTCYVSSGKVTDFVTLSRLPGVAMVAGDAAQTAVMVRAVKDEAVRRYDEAAAAKLRGETRAFDYPPIVLFLDEWGATWLSLSSMYKSTADFETDIDWILRVGREARVHVVLLSQTIRKTGAGAVPGSWQANLGLTISLGKPEAETYNNSAVFPSGSRERAELVGNRIAGKRGRGMAVLEGTVTEFQSYYVWSPGTTSLASDADKKVSPPTDEVRSSWERWEPVSASVPWLSPRLGLRVSGPEWAGTPGEKTDLKEVLATPIVALTDRAGNVKQGMERFDPWSPEWAGKRENSSRRTALSFDDEGDSGQNVDSVEVAQNLVTPPPPALTDITEMSDSERREAVRREAVRLGLIPDDESVEEPEMTEKPEENTVTKTTTNGYSL